MNRYLLNVSYVGTNFLGIQKTVNKLQQPQLDTKTIQGCVELALQSLRPVNPVQTVISSRTDSGVHALHNTLHVDLQRYDSQPFTENRLTSVLNRTLAKQDLAIRVHRTQHVPNTFHCRYNALGRTYLYRFAVAKPGVIPCDAKSNSAFEIFIPVDEVDRCVFLHPYNFDIEALKNAAQMFVGVHDFRTFMSTSRQKNTSRDHPMFTVRSIQEINIRPGRSLAIGKYAEKAESLYDYWEIEIKGKSFLYKQVRRIVGSLFSLACGRFGEKAIYHMLRVPSKNSWLPIISLAPARGLYLSEVHYDQEQMKFNTN